jgi:PPOX class probable F420-dependent enzyme
VLDDKTRSLAEGRNFAVLSSMLPSGFPQTQVMWVDTDGEHILLNTEIDRRKFENIVENPQVTVLIIEDGNWWSWSEIRGRVVDTIRGPEARAHIDKLAKKYLGKDEYPNPIRSERVIVKIQPERVVVK